MPDGIDKHVLMHPYKNTVKRENCAAGKHTSSDRGACGPEAGKDLSARRRRPLRRKLQVAKRPAVFATPPAAMAVMAPLQPEQVSGYRMHPALLDACLHLSAAALPTETPEAAITRVPVGVSALTVTELKHGHTPVPLAQPSPPQQDASVLCQYKLLAGSKCSIQVSDLLAKQARPMSSKSPGAGVGVEEIPMSELLYETQWQVTTSASRRSASQQPYFALARPTTGSVQGQLAAAYGRAKSGEVQLSRSSHAHDGLCALLNPTSSRRQRPRGTTAPTHAVSALLELWQTMSVQCHDRAFSLLTKAHSGTDLAGSSSSDAASRAAVSALMRVAAAENPGIAIACATSSPFEPMHYEVCTDCHMLDLNACLPTSVSHMLLLLMKRQLRKPMRMQRKVLIQLPHEMCI